LEEQESDDRTGGRRTSPRRSKSKAPASEPGPRWNLEVVHASSTTATAPLLAAVRAALAGAGGRCVAAAGGGAGAGAGAGKPSGRIQLRLFLNAQGKIERVERTGGDRAAESCLVKLLVTLSSATVGAGRSDGSSRSRSAGEGPRDTLNRCEVRPPFAGWWH